LSSSALVLGQQLHGVACWHDQSWHGDRDSWDSQRLWD